MKVTKAVWKVASWLDGNHRVILSTIIGASMVHNLFSLILLLRALLHKRGLLIPWMVSKMFIIMLMIISFTCWTFMSFFCGSFSSNCVSCTCRSFAWALDLSLEKSSLHLHQARYE